MIIVILCILIFLSILWFFHHEAIYRFSLLIGNMRCQQKQNNLKQCSGFVISDDDKSGPANSVRLGLQWENWMNDIISKHCNKNKIALDIGAHIGVHTVKLAKCAKLVYAFEPNPDSSKILEQNVKNFNNVVLIKKGVGNENKQSKFVVSEINSRSHLEQFSNTDRVEIVDQIRIDNMKILRPVGLIKIDVEGGEIDAFKGMENVLKRDKPVIIYEDHTGRTTQFLQSNFNYEIQQINKSNYIAIIKN